LDRSDLRTRPRRQNEHGRSDKRPLSHTYTSVESAASLSPGVTHAPAAVEPRLRLNSRAAQMNTRPRVFAIAAALAASAAVRAQYTPFHHDPKFLLEGHWQSCVDNTGRFDEKIYDQPQLDIEVHLGPGDEFAVFRGIK